VYSVNFEEIIFCIRSQWAPVLQDTNEPIAKVIVNDAGGVSGFQS